MSIFECVGFGEKKSCKIKIVRPETLNSAPAQSRLLKANYLLKQIHTSARFFIIFLLEIYLLTS